MREGVYADRFCALITACRKVSRSSRARLADRVASALARASADNGADPKPFFRFVVG
jgi:hypothetical protein